MDYTELGRIAARTNSYRFHGHDTHTHDAPQLVWVVSGRARLRFEGRSAILSGGQAAWIPAGVAHAMSLSDGGMVVGPLLEGWAVPPGGSTRILGPVDAVRDLVMVMLCAAPEDEEERAPLRRALGELLRAVTREYFPLAMPQHRAAHAIALEATRSGDTLDELAGRQFTSTRHVQRLFLEETGLSFARWRTRARLNSAIVNLRLGGSLTSAMNASGFSTRQGLLKALARECGIPLEQLVRDPVAHFAELESTA
ncbi:helix-turn-helix domain-containing protein [Occultella kanbiaonis]|uniref:helix-turn-helix domain-containing protein n=1 Tax=Occultella kanbiaonis TaxID=2675754 RepID=UPI0013D2ED39|nr:AraC family transcriptional regulator [Occultella kanbiaonis]